MIVCTHCGQETAVGTCGHCGASVHGEEPVLAPGEEVEYVVQGSDEADEAFKASRKRLKKKKQVA